MRNLALLAPLLLLPAKAGAQSPTAAVHANYSAYAAGLNVINVEADFAIDERGYRVDVTFRTAGTFGVFFKSESVSTVRGTWQGLHARPEQFRSSGTIRGEAHRTLIEYVGGQPTVRTIEPPVEQERDPVPASLQRDTVDTLSAMAELIHTATQTGHCDGGLRTFDGRRLGEIAVHTAGSVKLPPESRTAFSGDTLQCDFDGRQLGGWQHDVDRAELQKPQHGSAWLGHPIAGGPLVPVRMSFHTRFFGQATMYLTGTGPGRMPQASAQP